MQRHTHLRKLTAAQKFALVAELRALLHADAVVKPEEETLYEELESWLELPEEAGPAPDDSDAGRESLGALSKRDRAEIFVMAAMMALADGALSEAEAHALARLCAALQIEPDGARQVLQLFREDDSWREELADSFSAFRKLPRAKGGGMRTAFARLGRWLPKPRVRPDAGQTGPHEGPPRQVPATVKILLGVGLLAAPGAIPALLIGGAVKLLGDRAAQQEEGAPAYAPSDYDFESVR